MSRAGTYGSIMRLELAKSLAYRVHFMFSILTGPIFIAVQYYIWSSVLGTQGTVAGYALSGLISYFSIALLIEYLQYDDNAGIIEGYVLKGELTRVLTRPMTLIGELLARKLAHRSFAIVVEAIPIIALLSIIFGPSILMPHGPLVMIALGLFIAWMVQFLLNALIGFASFWTQNIHGLRMFYWPVKSLFAGLMFPLDLTPLWLQKILFVLPFQHMGYAPIKYWMGGYSLGGVEGLAVPLIWGLLWIGLLSVAVMFVQHKAYDQYQGVGQ